MTIGSGQCSKNEFLRFHHQQKAAAARARSYTSAVQLLYGRRSGVYRALFTIEERTVHVLHIRHSAQEELRPEDLASDDLMLDG